MKRVIVLFVFTMIGSFAIASLSNAAGSKLVEGDILKIEGEFYTVHDKAGHEVRLHVNKTTHLEGGAFSRFFISALISRSVPMLMRRPSSRPG